ncbi:serine-rich adhesin for platelets isoform X2 [Prorops nasuta]|uniref:serine-rich adhesin for platelets isoform X2 n=1 Tax=Prorops nasuta TaxID=863751 RepID=UPI0034CF3851
MEYRRYGASRYEEDILENEKGRSEGEGVVDKTSKFGAQTRGTAMSFGFRRRPTSGIPMPIASHTYEAGLLHPRSKSAGPEQSRRHDEDMAHRMTQGSSSGRSTPRLTPPKKGGNGAAVRTTRFGFRQPQAKYTNKVGDVYTNPHVAHYNQEVLQQQPVSVDNYSDARKHSSRMSQAYGTPPSSKQRASPINGSPSYNNNHSSTNDPNKRVSSIPESIGRYTLHTSHLPLPQFAVRMNDSIPKVAKTAANQSRKISSNTRGCTSSKEGSSTEDSGLGSYHGPSDLDYVDGASGLRRNHGRPRNLKMVVNGKNFDVRDVREEDGTVTEISVIRLPKTCPYPVINTGLVRERTLQYQRIVNKDNRYTESTTSMSTTSSEGYDEGLGEEKVYKDRSHSEKIPPMKSNFSLMSCDDPEYGHGEAMADDYSLSCESSDECQRITTVSSNQHPSQHLKAISEVAKSGTLPKSTLRSVLLTIEDPAFAAVAATSTTLIDDETSPVDSLFDSPTASITQSIEKHSRKECIVEAPLDNIADDDSPGTPTNASNSLSLSEGREYFDDEIADQPGLVFNDRGSRESKSILTSQNMESSRTLIQTLSKRSLNHVRSVENSPFHGRRMSRAGSVDTLSPCESIASDDLMLDFDRSDASSYEDSRTQRIDSNPALHELDDATIISELEAQGEEVMRQWTSLLGTQPQHNANTNNNNINNAIFNNNNNNNGLTPTESGTGSGRTSRLLRGSRSGNESPRSMDGMRSRPISSPLRTPKSIQSPNLDSGDEGSLRMERDTCQYMFQDIVSIKTMLLKLKRVLQESGENGLTRAETLNPFDNSMKNGLFYNLNEGNTTDTGTSPGTGENSFADELTDLRRQVVFLQGQVEDRDRTIQSLQFQISKFHSSNVVDKHNNVSKDNSNTSCACNAATQTEKLRPVSAGPSLLQSLPQDDTMGPLVSWNDTWNQRKGSDRSARILKQRQERQEYLLNQPNLHSEKILIENSINRRSVNKEAFTTKSNSTNEVGENAIKLENSSVKSFIPTPKRPIAITLIPRTTKAISITNRSHNT